MLHILWLIIKWILILLGILLGLIVMILMLFLFCPVRYKGKAKKGRTDRLREIQAFGEVSWLFHIISVQAFWEHGSLKTKICIFRVPLSKLKNLFCKRTKRNSSSRHQEEKGQANARTDQKTKPEIIKQDVTSELQKTEFQKADLQKDVVGETGDLPKEKISQILVDEESSEDEKKIRTGITGLIIKIMGKIKRTIGNLFRMIRNLLGIPQKILKKIRSLALTIRKFCDKINWWKELLDHPRTRAAISFLWKNAKKLIHHVLPTRITGQITFGNEDPAITGTVLAVLGMTIPFHKNRISAVPLFDGENVLEGEIMLKGRIYGVVVLKTAAELYFNKNIKYVIHRWRHKEVNHGERK